MLVGGRILQSILENSKANTQRSSEMSLPNVFEAQLNLHTRASMSTEVAKMVIIVRNSVNSTVKGKENWLVQKGWDELSKSGSLGQLPVLLQLYL